MTRNPDAISPRNENTNPPANKPLSLSLANHNRELRTSRNYVLYMAFRAREREKHPACDPPRYQAPSRDKARTTTVADGGNTVHVGRIALDNDLRVANM